MNVQELVRQALHGEIATTAPPPGEWQGVLTRGIEIRRRRRRARSVLGSLVVVALTMGTLAAVGTFTGRPSIVATPAAPSALPARVVALTSDDRTLVELDPVTGALRRTIASLPHDVLRVELTPDGSAAWLWEQPDGLPCSAQLNPGAIARVDLATGTVGASIRGASPALSSDGRRLAYVDVPCDAGQTASSVVVRDLVAGTDHRLSLQSPPSAAPYVVEGPLTWAGDSRHLVVGVTGYSKTTGAKSYESWYVDAAASTIENPQTIPISYAGPLDLAALGATAQFAAVVPGTTRVVELAVPEGTVRRTLIDFPDARFVSIAGIDQSGRHLLLLVADRADGSVALYRWSQGDAQPTRLAPGIFAADW